MYILRKLEQTQLQYAKIKENFVGLRIIQIILILKVHCLMIILLSFTRFFIFLGGTLCALYSVLECMYIMHFSVKLYTISKFITKKNYLKNRKINQQKENRKKEKKQDNKCRLSHLFFFLG